VTRLGREVRGCHREHGAHHLPAAAKELGRVDGRVDVGDDHVEATRRLARTRSLVEVPQFGLTIHGPSPDLRRE
jgi:hypothetical protein